MKKILFITGTRADYGKIKSLMNIIQSTHLFHLDVFVTGMHLSKEHGSTYLAVQADHWENIHIDFASAGRDAGMAQSLGQIISSLSNYIRATAPDLVVVHGDRIEALAGATSAVLQNVRLAHIEGGEVSGTIDDSLRHAITKLAHEHLVSTEQAYERIIKLGEDPARIHIIGSPDIDVMMSSHLPSLKEVLAHYDIPFDKFAIVMLHPVTTQLEQLQEHVRIFVNALLKSNHQYIVIYPNNDSGFETILAEYRPFRGNNNFKLFPSIRFEAFLTLLKHAEFLIGNSSAGIREAGIYGTPAIDIGSRQTGRFNLQKLPHLQHIEFSESEIKAAIASVKDHQQPSKTFGEGQSAKHFLNVLLTDDFWLRPLQKRLTY